MSVGFDFPGMVSTLIAQGSVPPSGWPRRMMMNAGQERARMMPNWGWMYPVAGSIMFRCTRRS